MVTSHNDTDKKVGVLSLDTVCLKICTFPFRFEKKKNIAYFGNGSIIYLFYCVLICFLYLLLGTPEASPCQGRAEVFVMLTAHVKLRRKWSE